VVTPVSDEVARARLDRILSTELADKTGWELGADGSYNRRTVHEDSFCSSAQEQFVAWTLDELKGN
jgi:polyphosphate kinase